MDRLELTKLNMASKQVWYIFKLYMTIIWLHIDLIWLGMDFTGLSMASKFKSDIALSGMGVYSISGCC